MRVVAGRFRGTTLDAPDGRETRPTSDRARESLFNILENGKHTPGIRGARIIDLFAGTGALGIEALSRGAEHCTFAENNRDTLDVLKRNIAKLKLADETRILGSVLTLPANVGRPVDIALLDPPYGRDLLEPALNSLLAGEWISPDSLIVVQLHPKEQFSPSERFTILDDRKYGAARFLFLNPNS